MKRLAVYKRIRRKMPPPERIIQPKKQRLLDKIHKQEMAER